MEKGLLKKKNKQKEKSSQLLEVNVAKSDGNDSDSLAFHFQLHHLFATQMRQSGCWNRELLIMYVPERMTL